MNRSMPGGGPRPNFLARSFQTRELKGVVVPRKGLSVRGIRSNKFSGLADPRISPLYRSIVPMSSILRTSNGRSAPTGAISSRKLGSSSPPGDWSVRTRRAKVGIFVCGHMQHSGRQTSEGISAPMNFRMRLARTGRRRRNKLSLQPYLSGHSRSILRT
jgi:hypothetical protein